MGRKGGGVGRLLALEVPIEGGLGFWLVCRVRKEGVGFGSERLLSLSDVVFRHM